MSVGSFTRALIDLEASRSDRPFARPPEDLGDGTVRGAEIDSDHTNGTAGNVDGGRVVSEMGERNFVFQRSP